MSPRTALLGVVALVAAVVMLVATDSTAATTVGVVLLLAGVGVTTAAGLLGLTTEDPGRTSAAEQAKEAADAVGMQRAAETGRWPRIIGGG